MNFISVILFYSMLSYGLFVNLAYDATTKLQAISPEEIANAYENACKQDVSPYYCYILALKYETGSNGIKQDKEKALKLQEQICMQNTESFACVIFEGLLEEKKEKQALKDTIQACDKGDLKECINLAYRYDINGGAKTDKDINMTKAISLYKIACDGGVLDGCFKLARSYKDVEGNNEKSLEIYEQICNAGEMEGCFELARSYKDVEKNDKKSLEIYEQICNAGEMEGCSILGYYYGSNMDAKKIDYEKAASFWQKACDGGAINKCSKLASMYKEGIGVEKDIKKAVSLWKKSCLGRHIVGCVEYGLSMYNNLDEREGSIELLGLICDHGYEYGCNSLGVIHTNLKDYKKAISLFEKTCNAGNDDGCIFLMHMYKKGIGVEQDKQKSYDLFKKMMCKNGREPCVEEDLPLSQIYMKQESVFGLDKDKLKTFNTDQVDDLFTGR